MERVTGGGADATHRGIDQRLQTCDISPPVVRDLPIVHLPDARQDGSLPRKLPEHPDTLGARVDSFIRVVGCAVPQISPTAAWLSLGESSNILLVRRPAK